MAFCFAVPFVPRATQGQQPDPTVRRPATETVDGAKPFAPGVRIDWKTRAVEVDAKVVLRKGALELLACSPQTREHESILSVSARPTHVYQALGLVGLEPGSPVRYDKRENRLIPPSGAPLDIDIRYVVKGKQKTEPATRWLVDVERKRSPESVNWVFAGSDTYGDGRFAADLDGTIICVVDFETALITVGALHTADNRNLWLAANTDAIPPVDSPCTLVIRGASLRPLDVVVMPDGSLRVHNRPITTAALAARAKPETADPTGIRIRLRPAPETTKTTIESTIETLNGAGIAREAVRVERVEQHPQSPSAPE
ncbi:MAG: YdjY domain-containing protein [Phycisphaerae bacterium]